MMEESWNGNYRTSNRVFRFSVLSVIDNISIVASNDKEQQGCSTRLEFREICDDWVNYSSFIARCIEAGLDKVDDHFFKYPIVDIPIGLEDEIPPGLARDCKVMAAALYISLAGRSLVQRFFKPPYKIFGVYRWRRWAEKLAEISKEDGNPRLAYAAKEARRHMVSLHPGFIQPML
jgi:hypothetical protein